MGLGGCFLCQHKSMLRSLLWAQFLLLLSKRLCRAVFGRTQTIDLLLPVQVEWIVK